MRRFQFTKVKSLWHESTVGHLNVIDDMNIDMNIDVIEQWHLNVIDDILNHLQKPFPRLLHIAILISNEELF